MTDPGDDAPFSEPVRIPIEESLDLHFFRAAEVAEVVEAYLEAAVEAGFREVRLIHGRGRGVQRNRVQRILERHPLVERYADAPTERGGWGATIAWLRGPGPGDPVRASRREGSR
jgi:dsDNA-specific endonuclease/ATPase MutS2